MTKYAAWEFQSVDNFENKMMMNRVNKRVIKTSMTVENQKQKRLLKSTYIFSIKLIAASKSSLKRMLFRFCRKKFSHFDKESFEWDNNKFESHEMILNRKENVELMINVIDINWRYKLRVTDTIKNEQHRQTRWKKNSVKNINNLREDNVERKC
jgi:hypothetical protein